MASSSRALRVVVFLGTVRENNYGSRVAKLVMNKLQQKGHEATLLDPAVLDLPLLQKPFHFYKNPQESPQVLQDTNKVIEEADAFMVLSAEYNHSMPPALTNMMDYFPVRSYKYRPTGIVCYSAGPFGGVRAAMQVRCFMGELGSPTVGTLFAIPQVQNVLTVDGAPQGDNGERIDKNCDKIITELAWLAEAIKKQREAIGLPAVN
jgi:NAD(P)H-dependent FMN reductase